MHGRRRAGSRHFLLTSSHLTLRGGLAAMLLSVAKGGRAPSTGRIGLVRRLEAAGVKERSRKIPGRPVRRDLPRASANAESKRRPADLKPILSLTKRAASAAPYSRSMPQS